MNKTTKPRSASTGHPAGIVCTVGIALFSLALSPLGAAAQQIVLRVGEDVVGGVQPGGRSSRFASTPSRSNWARTRGGSTLIRRR